MAIISTSAAGAALSVQEKSGALSWTQVAR